MSDELKAAEAKMKKLGADLKQLGAEMGQMGTKMGQMGTKMGQMGTKMKQLGAEMGQLGAFDLDEFKRLYTSESISDAAIPYLWTKFDPEHYTVWQCEYKPQPTLHSAMVRTLQDHRDVIDRLFKREENLAQDVFASVCLFGQKAGWSVAGVWICRDKKLMSELSATSHDDFKWKEYELMDSEEKNRVNQYLLQKDGNFGADHKPFKECKIFK